MNREIYLYIGGAYADSKVQSVIPPTKDDVDSWSHGETEIFKFDLDMQVWEFTGGFPGYTWELVNKQTKV